jgi:TctA family transporter
MTLADAFVHLFTLKAFAIMLGGVALGVSVGVLPGITAGMLMALTLPFTYHMTSVEAVSLLIAMFVGGVSGGLITATLMRIPGEPNSIMTCLDGYQLARRGQPGPRSASAMHRRWWAGRCRGWCSCCSRRRWRASRWRSGRSRTSPSS